MADLAGEMLDEAHGHGVVARGHQPQGHGRDQPALGVTVGLGAGSGQAAVEDLHLPHAGARLEDVDDLDLAPPVGPENLQGPLDHHEHPGHAFPLGEHRGAVGVAPEFAHAGKFFRLRNGQAGQIIDSSQVDHRLPHRSPFLHSDLYHTFEAAGNKGYSFGQTALLGKFKIRAFLKGKTCPMKKAPHRGAFQQMGIDYFTRSMKVRSTVLTRIFSPASM